jgi:hypothetical protein
MLVHVDFLNEVNPGNGLRRVTSIVFDLAQLPKSRYHRGAVVRYVENDTDGAVCWYDEESNEIRWELP